MSTLLYIDCTICTGCGTCIDDCPVDAIRLDENTGVASIDQKLCNECLACLEVCPDGAIRQADSSELVPVGGGEVLADKVVTGQVKSLPVSSSMVTIREPGKLVVLTGVALTFISNHLLPRAADALVESMERRLARGRKQVSPDGSLRSGGRSLQEEGGRGRGGRRGGGRWRQQRRRMR